MKHARTSLNQVLNSFLVHDARFFPRLLATFNFCDCIQYSRISQLILGSQLSLDCRCFCTWATLFPPSSPSLDYFIPSSCFGECSRSTLRLLYYYRTCVY